MGSMHDIYSRLSAAVQGYQARGIKQLDSSSSWQKTIGELGWARTGNTGSLAWVRWPRGWLCWNAGSRPLLSWLEIALQEGLPPRRPAADRPLRTAACFSAPVSSHPDLCGLSASLGHVGMGTGCAAVHLMATAFGSHGGRAQACAGDCRDCSFGKRLREAAWLLKRCR